VSKSEQLQRALLLKLKVMHGWIGKGTSAKGAALAAPFAMVAAFFIFLLCAAGGNAAAVDFGSPPPGEIPILYNDHNVYAKPDLLKAGRVLAALVKDGHMYVPLRSLFEQMGAIVSISDDGKTVTAVKGATRVSVTLRRNVVVINGEARPLDVPPIFYKGVVLVPVRVLSEALDAYVQWVPSMRVVVVRYIPPLLPATAPPIGMPTAAPTLPPPVASATPTTPPARHSYHAFIEGALAAPKNYNEFSDGQFCRLSYAVAGAWAPENSPLAIKVDFREDVYVTSDNLIDQGNHYTQFATIDGGYSLTPVFLARQSSLDARLEFKIASPRIYVGIGYLQTANNYGYPHLSALGVGFEKLPDLQPGFNFYGSGFYYPTASGHYTVDSASSPNFGTAYRQEYQDFKYDVGVALVPAHFPVYLYGGFNGDQDTAKQDAPIGQTHNGPYVGLGVKL
jgi:hypothetical protein